ncbi:MAG: RNA polymerase sigma factor [Bacteroidota bacterium]
MTTVSDVELIDQFRNGKTEAFNLLVARYREKVYWVARRMMSNHEDADDIVQEVFIRVYGHLSNFRAESGFYTWLYRITVNVSLNALRKKRIKNFIKLDEIVDTLIPDEGYADEQVLKQEYETILEKAIETLPPKQKMVFILKYYDEMPFEEMAKMLKKSVGGLKANYFHALQKIQKYVRSESNK